MVKYPAIFFEDGNYIGVEFPDLPGCFSQADDLNHAIMSAKKALRCYLSNVEEKDYPTPSATKNYLNAMEIEMYPIDDDSHTKLFNEKTQKVVVIPMNLETLGEKLQQKILQAADII